MRHQLFVLTLLCGLSGLALSHDYTSEHLHGFFVIEDEAPPPVEPPADPRAHFRAECAKSGVVGCLAAESPEDVFAAADRDRGRQNTPESPLLSSSCIYNGGTRDCVPAWRQIQGAAWGDYGDCVARDALRESIGHGQSSAEHASTQSPCYDTEHDAAQTRLWLSNWASSQGTLVVVEPGEYPMNGVHSLQYEIKFGASFFQDYPRSNSWKSFRIDQRPDASGCDDARNADGRLRFVKETEGRISHMYYCDTGDGGSRQIYAQGDSEYRVQASEAGVWFRHTITWHTADPTQDYIETTLRRLDTGEIVMQAVQTAYNDVPLDLPDVATVTGVRFILHGSGHEPSPGAPDAELWVRNYIYRMGAAIAP